MVHGRSRVLYPIARVVVQREYANGWYGFVEKFHTYCSIVSRKRTICGVGRYQGLSRAKQPEAVILNGMKI